MNFYLSGDFYLKYYNNFAFAFLKTIQFFMRGSMDNSDHDSSIDKYAFTNTANNFNPNFAFKSFVNSDGIFRGIVYHVGFTGFFIVKNNRI